MRPGGLGARTLGVSERQAGKSDREWRERLTPAQYEVLRRAGTEPAFTGEYTYNKASGEYRCAACGARLFDSDTKFDSGTGWPSFTEPAVAEAVELRPDNSHFMQRAGADGSALLHQLGRARLSACRRAGRVPT